MYSEFPLKAYRLKVITHYQRNQPLWSQPSEPWLKSSMKCFNFYPTFSFSSNRYIYNSVISAIVSLYIVPHSNEYKYICCHL